jgi:hypothetical protein
MDICGQSTLVPIIKFTSFIQKLCYQHCVAPVHIFFRNTSHELFAKLGSREWPINKGRRFFKFKRLLTLLLRNEIV